jgi:hypothetical protein
MLIKKKQTGIELLSFKNLIERKLIKNIVICYTTKQNKESIYVSEKELHDFKEIISKTVAVEELKSFDRRVNDYLMTRIIHGKKGVIGTFPKAFIAPFTKSSHYRIQINDVNKYLDSEAKESNYKYELVKTKDSKDLLEKEIKYFRYKYSFTETINIFNEFILDVLNNYDGNKYRERINRYLNYFKYLLKLLDKEIYDYSDAELIKYFYV